ncbi:PadR family transcriptional regulator [Kitasatospora aureofaciens]|uniref:PadR family transcriptional regulator n=1 Tax=Kitasatospora aureofaciens TaxID=1894 RepID=UPI000526EDA9|nr:PadR family transcriptional regulator [Kitasatospora aureofaciens]
MTTKRSMQEPTFLLLTALADRPRHGYALGEEVAAISDGRVRLGAGSLYGTLDRLLSEGLIRVEREETVDGRPRRVFALTPAGTQALMHESERMRSALREADRRLSSFRARLAGGTA